MKNSPMAYSQVSTLTQPMPCVVPQPLTFHCTYVKRLVLVANTAVTVICVPGICVPPNIYPS